MRPAMTDICARALRAWKRAGTVSPDGENSAGEAMPQTRQLVVIPDDIGGSFRSSPSIERFGRIATVEFHSERASDEAELIATRSRRQRHPVVPPCLHKVSQSPSLTPRRTCGMVCISGTGIEDVAVADASGARHRGRQRAGTIQSRCRGALSRADVRGRAGGSGAGSGDPARRVEGRCRASNLAARRSASSASAEFHPNSHRSRAGLE